MIDHQSDPDMIEFFQMLKLKIKNTQQKVTNSIKSKIQNVLFTLLLFFYLPNDVYILHHYDRNKEEATTKILMRISSLIELEQEDDDDDEKERGKFFSCNFLIYIYVDRKKAKKNKRKIYGKKDCCQNIDRIYNTYIVISFF
jgi:hypothetical protein